MPLRLGEASQFTENLTLGTLQIKNLLLISSVLSLLIGTIVGLKQIKVKRLLAFSSISHVGFLLLALGIYTQKSVDSFIFYLVQYSVTSLNIFLILLAFGYLENFNHSNKLNHTDPSLFPVPSPSPDPASPPKAAEQEGEAAEQEGVAAEQEGKAAPQKKALASLLTEESEQFPFPDREARYLRQGSDKRTLYNSKDINGNFSSNDKASFFPRPLVLKEEFPSPASPKGRGQGDINFLIELKGQIYKNPVLSISLAICLFSMAGIPPLIGFFSKQFVLFSSIENGYNFLSIVAILVSVISASYYLRIIKITFFEKKRESFLPPSKP